jgi:hypothetical protein
MIPSSSHLRPAARLAALGGACWLAFAVQGLLSRPESTDSRVVLSTTGDYVGFGLFAVCLALAVPALLAVHLHQRGADGRLGRAGCAIATCGAAAQSVVIAGIVVNGGETSWFGVGAPLAILTWFAGSIVLGVATRRAGVLPSWVAWTLPPATLLAVVGADYGLSAILGAFQIVVGARILGAGRSSLPGRVLNAADA